jgi:hypothetical protein
MKDLEIIRSLLYSDLKERLQKRRVVYSIDAHKERITALTDAIAECCSMSDINELVCIYHYLFADHPRIGHVVSIDGTQNYVIDLLTNRIATDLEVILTKTTLKPQSPLGPLKHEYKSKN